MNPVKQNCQKIAPTTKKARYVRLPLEYGILLGALRTHFLHSDRVTVRNKPPCPITKEVFFDVPEFVVVRDAKKSFHGRKVVHLGIL